MFAQMITIVYIYEYCHVLSISFPFRFCKWAEVFAGIRSA